jgi:hypothetical protein
MERELKIVVLVFLTYLIFGLTSFFQTGSLITPIFLTKVILVILALIFLLMNLKEQHYWILVYALIGFTAFAFTDDFVISYLSQKISGFEKLFTETDLFNWLSFALFFSFLFFAILFFWIKKKNKVISIFLFVDLIFCLSLFFTDLGWVQEISIKVFFLTFFIASQSDFEVKNKTLRVLSYLFLGLFLLESFEYFI